MSTLKVRLARLGGVKSDDADGRLARIRQQMQGLRHRPHPEAKAPCLADVLLGGEQITAHGPLHVVVGRQRLDYCHGTVPLSACLAATGDHLATLALEPQLAQVDPHRLLFVDTETTGLAGGTGTVPFLIGLAWFEGDAWHLEQLLLRRPGEEIPVLQRVAERLQNASGIVTYNGKSFDWPLIKTRFVMSRLPVPPPLPHIDLLHCTRRVLRRRNTPLRLVNVEQTLLGYHRHDDIDGADIPGMYFAFLRGAPPACLNPILSHNGDDLLALPALMGTLARHLSCPSVSAHAGDRLSLAELMHRAGAYERALLFAQAAAQDTAMAGEALMLVARLHGKQQKWRAAADALHDATSLTAAMPDRHAAVHLILAKLYEHRLTDLPRALQHATHTLLAEGPLAHQVRLARLKRRLGAADFRN